MRVEPVDRIVVANARGEIYLLDGDGANRFDLVEDGNIGLQPVWAPDGTRVAWSQRDGSNFSVVSAKPDGTARAEDRTPFSSYFGLWDPTSVRTGFLGNAPPGTGLVVAVGANASLEVVDSDTFYYFSWSPDGTRWVVHSGSGLHITGLDGDRRDIELADAQFRAPVWAPDGQILLAIANAGRNVIVSFDPETELFNELIEVDDVVNFVLDPTGRFLAIESIDLTVGDDGGAGNGVTVALQPPGPQAQVLVYDLASGDVTAAYDGITGGFWWSPDGGSLAMLVAEDRVDPRFAQWLVWDPQGSFRTEPFAPSPAFLSSYVPFFDQFAQSVTPWSPDSSRFVYSGTDAGGRSGVFVQLAQPDVPPDLIVEDNGTAFWSPR